MRFLGYILLYTNLACAVLDYAMGMLGYTQSFFLIPISLAGAWFSWKGIESERGSA